MDKEEILLQRKNKFLSVGRNRGFSTQSNLNESLSIKENNFNKIRKFFLKYKKQLMITGLILFFIYIFLKL